MMLLNCDAQVYDNDKRWLPTSFKIADNCSELYSPRYFLVLSVMQDFGCTIVADKYIMLHLLETGVGVWRERAASENARSIIFQSVQASSR